MAQRPRIVVRYCLGAPICSPCKSSLGKIVDVYGIHSSVWKRACLFIPDFRWEIIASTGLLYKQTSHRPSRFKDRKRPVGLTLVPWTHGRVLGWDYTCVHRLASSCTQFAGRARTYCGRFFRVTKEHQIRGYFITAQFRTIEMEALGGLGTEVHALMLEINHHY